ncbi:hypothetical protein [Caudoviricetes sp.]|nr:hypothetical protein [Caudoviricetes sp.]
MADAQLSKLAKAAGTSFGLFKAQLSREGHKIRGDVDYREMTGLSVAAVALRDQYVLDQEALDAYAQSGGYQASLDLDDDKPKRSEAKKKPRVRGIGSEVVKTYDGEHYRATTTAHDEGILLVVDRLDDDFKEIQRTFERTYLESSEAWDAWDDYASGLVPIIERTSGKQKIGAVEYVITVQPQPVAQDEGEETVFYFEVVGETVETNGTRATEAEAWTAVDIWARNKFAASVVADIPVPKDQPAESKPKRTRKK